PVNSFSRPGLADASSAHARESSSAVRCKWITAAMSPATTVTHAMISMIMAIPVTIRPPVLFRDERRVYLQYGRHHPTDIRFQNVRHKGLPSYSRAPATG